MKSELSANRRRAKYCSGDIIMISLFVTIALEKPPFGAIAPLSPIGGKNPYHRAFFLSPLGERMFRNDRKGAYEKD